MTDLPLHVEAPAPVPEKTREIDRSGEPVFELRSIWHSYGRNRVIFDVNMSVWPGEVSIPTKPAACTTRRRASRCS